MNQSSPSEDTEIRFKVLNDPNNLEKLQLIWQLLLECNTEKVWNQAVQFLIKCYISLDDELFAQRSEICQSLISLCITILKRANNSSTIIKRVIYLIKSLIQECEIYGVNVQSHSTIIQAEWIDRVIIKNLTKTRNDQDPELIYILTLRSNITMWEFIDRISRMCRVSPQYSIIKNS